MHLQAVTTVLDLFFTSALALTLPSSLSFLNTNFSSSALIDESLNATAGTSLFGTPIPVCFPSISQRYPHSKLAIRSDSCHNAWSKIGRSKVKHGFTSRQNGFNGDTPLPLRYLSDDGHCAMELRQTDAAGGKFQATIDDFTISEYAGAVLVKCVDIQKSGGFLVLPSEYAIRPPKFV